MNKEIVMETTHGRKSKCKTEFKAVVNKVLVSGVVLATLYFFADFRHLNPFALSFKVSCTSYID